MTAKGGMWYTPVVTPPPHPVTLVFYSSSGGGFSFLYPTPFQMHLNSPAGKRKKNLDRCFVTSLSGITLPGSERDRLCKVEKRWSGRELLHFRHYWHDSETLAGVKEFAVPDTKSCPPYTYERDCMDGHPWAGNFCRRLWLQDDDDDVATSGVNKVI